MSVVQKNTFSKAETTMSSPDDLFNSAYSISSDDSVSK